MGENIVTNVQSIDIFHKLICQIVFGKSTSVGQRFYYYLQVVKKKPQHIENVQLYFNILTAIFQATNNPTLIQTQEFGHKRLNG